MDVNKKILIVIPAHNEGKILKDLIPSIKKVIDAEIVVVNDGSTDDTTKVSLALGATVLEHSINRGAGAATKTGITYALKKNADFVITMDGDGQHHPDDIKNIIKTLLSGQYDVVIGSRLLQREKMPLTRQIFNKIGNIITFILTGLYVQDSQSGFKAFTRNAIKKINFEYDGYEFCTQIISEIKKNNLKFIEIPIQTIYTDYSLSKGQSFSKGISTVIKLVIGK